MRDGDKLSYRPEIDGLRGLAVLAVMLFHAQVPYFEGGFVGVDIFFVISGYLITRILWNASIFSNMTLLQFYERRARRILPALLVTSLVSAVAAWKYLSPPALEEFGGHLLGSSFFVANIVYWMQAGYFSTKAEYLPLLHTWSLAIEEQFYIFYPILLLLLLRAGKMVAVAALSLFAVASLFVSHRLSTSAIGADAAFFLLPSRSWELLAGAITAKLEPMLTSGKTPNNAASSTLAALGMGLCLAPVFAFDAKTLHPSLLTAVPVLGACMAILYGNSKTIVGRSLIAPPFVALGLVSYSAYLFHQPILAFARIAIARELSYFEAAAAILAAIGLGAVSWKLVEQPFRNRNLVSQRSVGIMSIAAIGVPALIGGSFFLQNGFPGRMERAVSATLDQIERGRSIRRAGIRLTKCHFNANVDPDLGKYLQSWDCFDGGQTRILIVGDSIAADKAWMLREAGFNVGNIGGAGCGIVPPSNKDNPCWQILVKARDIIRSGKVSGLILSNNWTGPVPASELQSIVAYWADLKVPVLIFSGMPVFSDFQSRVTKNIREAKPLETITFDEDKFKEHLRSLAPLQSAGFVVLNSRDLLCGPKAGPCGAFEAGQPLVGDPTHLQPAGVRRMAGHIQQNQTWLQWYNQHK